MDEARMEQDARTAKSLMDEFAAWNSKAQAFIQSTGNQPQEPSMFLKNVILAFGMKKLESKIITLKQ